MRSLEPIVEIKVVSETHKRFGLKWLTTAINAFGVAAP